MQRSKKIISILGGLLILALLAGSAPAATLEEKVETLEKIVEQQQQQIDQLTEAKKTSVSPFKNDKVLVTLYGQLNRALLYVDDGDDDELYNVDNDHSSTRFGLNGSAKAFEGITLGTKIEVEYQANASNKVSQREKSGIDDGLTRRHLDIFVAFERYGKISLGHGSAASDGASEVDLSGTTVVGYSDITTFAGGQFFYNSASNSLTETRISDVFDNLDGLGRDSRIRYDTPKLYGLTFSTSALSGSGHDFALRYGLDHDLFDLEAAAAYAKRSGDETINGSVSLLLNSGLNVTLAAGSKDYDEAGRDDGDFLYGKIGYLFSAFTIGKTACSIDIGEYKNFDGDDTATAAGLQLVQNINAWNTEVYLGFRNHEFDRSSHKDINALMSGLRVKF